MRRSSGSFAKRDAAAGMPELSSEHPTTNEWNFNTQISYCSFSIEICNRSGLSGVKSFHCNCEAELLLAIPPSQNILSVQFSLCDFVASEIRKRIMSESTGLLTEQ